jgi:hypothetical protein
MRILTTMMGIGSIAGGLVLFACSSDDSSQGATGGETGVSGGGGHSGTGGQPGSGGSAGSAGHSGTGGQAGSGATDDPLGGIQIFPSDYVWNTKIDTMPVSPYSADMIQNQNGLAGQLRPSFGYALNVVNASTAEFLMVTSYYPSPAGPYAYPKTGMQITNQNPDGTCNTAAFDCSAIVVDTDTKTSYEFYNTPGVLNPDGSISAGSAAIWPFNDYSLDFATHGTVPAAVSSHMVGQVRYEEVEAGAIPHAIQIAVPYTRYDGHVWPAQWTNSIYTTMTGPTYMRMGERIRLKASFDASGYSGTNQIIIQALKDYGMIVVDNGDLQVERTYEMRGIMDSRWESADLAELQQITGEDLEVIDETSLMISEDSGEVQGN